jgi:hypothetical protein
MDGKEVDFSHIPRSPGRLAVRGIPAPFDVERPPFFKMHGLQPDFLEGVPCGEYEAQIFCRGNFNKRLIYTPETVIFGLSLI